MANSLRHDAQSTSDLLCARTEPHTFCARSAGGCVPGISSSARGKHVPNILPVPLCMECVSVAATAHQELATRS